MTDENILREAICKAEGYKYGCILFPSILQNKEYYSIIFSHDFAKKFWGEGFCDGYTSQYKIKNSIDGDGYGVGFYEGKLWEWHLMQMVLEEKPLKYLEKFLK